MEFVQYIPQNNIARFLIIHTYLPLISMYLEVQLSVDLNILSVADVHLNEK